MDYLYVLFRVANANLLKIVTTFDCCGSIKGSWVLFTPTCDVQLDFQWWNNYARDSFITVGENVILNLYYLYLIIIIGKRRRIIRNLHKFN